MSAESSKAGPRLAPIDPTTLDEAQQRYYDALLAGPRGQPPYRQRLLDEDGCLRGPFNARLLDPPVGQALQAVGAALRFESRISARWREIAILQVARVESSEVEWASHSAAAQRAGVTEKEVEAVAAGRSCASFSAEDKLAQDVVRALLDTGDLDDALFEAAHDRLGDVVIFDLVSLVGHYRHTALALRVWRVQP